MAQQTVFLVVGPPGTGKSYERAARWLVDEFLPNRTGPHWSNFPIDCQAVADYCARVHKMDRDAVLARIKKIDPAELEDWRHERSGPWEYFRDRSDGTNPLALAHVAIDEAHVYLPRGLKSGMEWRKKWEGWLGTIRHRGCTVEFLTQDESKVAREITAHCESRIVLSTLGETRLPFVGIRVADFYQIVSKLRGRALRATVIEEQQRIGNTWERSGGRINVLKAEYFPLYDSHNATEHGDSGAKQEQEEWERFGWLRFTSWLLSRYKFALAWRVALLVTLCTVGHGFVNGWLVRLGMSRAITSLTKPKDAPGAAGKPSTAPEQRNKQTTTPGTTEAWDYAYTTITGLSRDYVATDEWLAKVGEPVGSWPGAPVVEAIERGRGTVVLDDGTRVLVGSRLRYTLQDTAQVSGRIRTGQSSTSPSIGTTGGRSQSDSTLRGADGGERVRSAAPGVRP